MRRSSGCLASRERRSAGRFAYQVTAGVPSRRLDSLLLAPIANVTPTSGAKPGLTAVTHGQAGDDRQACALTGKQSMRADAGLGARCALVRTLPE
jgi:outer membrane usher protein FimD/PapC